MKRSVSRRSFLKKTALGLGAVGVCNLECMVRAQQGSDSRTLFFAETQEETMPHVVVKLYPGRSEQQKIRLAEEIVKDVVAIMKCGQESVSVAIEEVKPEDWAAKVYKPDILDKPEKLYKKPGYNPFK